MSGKAFLRFPRFLLLGVVCSLIPTVLKGKILVFHMFTILPGVTITLRADAMSMIFALVASSLWTIAVFYSMGYMRGLNEHAQTRFNACFALAIFGAIGVAFSDNLLTMYLFYEIVSICTYPLVAHHQDEEGYNGARKYIVYLTATAKAFLLPAMILIYVLTGTLDFATNISTGIFPAGCQQGAGGHALYLLPLRFCQKRHHALSSLAAGCHGRTHSGFCPAPCRGRGQGRCLLYHPGDALRLRRRYHGCPESRHPHCLFRRIHRHHGLGPGPVQRQPEGTAGLFDGQPALLYHHGCGPAHPCRH